MMKTPTTALDRLDAAQARLQDMVTAVDLIHRPLEDFYNSLDDEQKAHFNLIGANQPAANPPTEPASLTQFCGPQNAIPVVSVEDIDKAVAPNPQQQADLVALRNAATKADETIVATCPAHPPLTPPGRLDAVRNRLQAMLQAIDIVRPPLQTFYASLSDDQKARFDAMGEQPGSGQNGT